MKNKGQQEIVGFVLIVVLVVVALMVYLGMSIRSTSEDSESEEASNILNAFMKQTTKCATAYEPNYDNFEYLFKSAHREKTCSNLGVSAFDYLNESASEVLSDIFASESSITGYRLEFAEKLDDDILNHTLVIEEGNKTKTQKSAIRTISSGSSKLVVRLKIYSI